MRLVSVFILETHNQTIEMFARFRPDGERVFLLYKNGHLQLAKGLAMLSFLHNSQFYIHTPCSRALRRLYNYN